MSKNLPHCSSGVKVVIRYHGERERVDVVDVLEAVLPRDEALDVNVQLIPDSQDGLIILLIP